MTQYFSIKTAVKSIPLTLSLGITGVIFVGVIDHLTGYEVRLFPLYFLPIAFVAWRLSRPYALALSALSSLTWALANFLAGKVYSSPFTWPVNVLSQLAAFATVGVLVSDLRRRLLAEKELNRQDQLTALLNSRAFYEKAVTCCWHSRAVPTGRSPLSTWISITSRRSTTNAVTWKAIAP